MSESPRKKRTVKKVPPQSGKPKKRISKPRVKKPKAVFHADVKPTDKITAQNQSSESEQPKCYAGPVMRKLEENRGFEFPSGYGDNMITLMVRDPYWMHAYWEIAGSKIDELRGMMGGENFSKSKKILRVYDVTDVHFTGMNANKSFDIDLSHDAKNWYVHSGEPNRSWCVDIGFLSPEGKFYVAARSNIVSTPRDQMSEVVDEEWMSIDWDRMYAMSGGFGVGRSSGEIREMLKKRLREELSSGSFVSSFVRKEENKPKDFWLVANTELIVYGATEPTAKLTIQGLPIKLRPDGTFTLRFALPDGKQEIPIVAVNREGDKKRTITPVVEKNTK
jgi:hypothetical protein